MDESINLIDTDSEDTEEGYSPFRNKNGYIRHYNDIMPLAAIVARKERADTLTKDEEEALTKYADRISRPTYDKRHYKHLSRKLRR